MSFTWHKDLPVWDEQKKRIIGGAPDGIFDTRFASLKVGDPIPGMWYRVDEGDKAVGYGWVDVVWGDAEILLATETEEQSKGAGTFILEQLDAEARNMGLNYIYNIIRPTHPQADKLKAWLEARGFAEDRDGRLLRSVGKAAK